MLLQQSNHELALLAFFSLFNVLSDGALILGELRQGEV